MQIHELDPFIGEVSDDTVIAIDDGIETCKVPASIFAMLADTSIDQSTITLYESLGWTPPNAE